LEHRVVTDKGESDEPGPVYAFYFATIRVEIDPRDESVNEVLVDEGSMAVPTVIVEADGRPLTGAARAAAMAIASHAEWPSWDYGSTRQGPAAQ
jgi:hypothetical protein